MRVNSSTNYVDFNTKTNDIKPQLLTFFLPLTG